MHRLLNTLHHIIYCFMAVWSEGSLSECCPPLAGGCPSPCLSQLWRGWGGEPVNSFSPLQFHSHEDACVLSCLCVQPFVTLWTVARQTPLSMGFSRQEYWSGLPCPPPGDLPDPGIKPAPLASPALAGGFFTTVPGGKH